MQSWVLFFIPPEKIKILIDSIRSLCIVTVMWNIKTSKSVFIFTMHAYSDTKPNFIHFSEINETDTERLNLMLFNISDNLQTQWNNKINIYLSTPRDDPRFAPQGWPTHSSSLRGLLSLHSRTHKLPINNWLVNFQINWCRNNYQWSQIEMLCAIFNPLIRINKQEPWKFQAINMPTSALIYNIAKVSNTILCPQY